MGFLDRLFGSETTEAPPPPAAPRSDTKDPQRDENQIAVERYRYLLRTAPPETIEQVHREAFAKLTDDQRALVYEELSRGAQTGERPLSSEPATLARAATRAEFRQPGTMERVLGGSGGRGGGPSFGSMVGSTLLGTVAGYVIGSALVSAFLPFDGGASQADASGDSGSNDSSDSGSGDSGSGDAGSADASGADASSADFGGGDFGGGDFGGGDFGGGDFGGGDFGGDFGF